MKKVKLVLEDGQTYIGNMMGRDTEVVGELVFTTGMGGYIETLTDPSYYGQIIMQTFPLIGNYGMIKSDIEGNCGCRGYVVSDICDNPSNFRCEETLDAFLKENNITGIYGIDTREITMKLRDKGVMNAIICDVEKEVNLEEIKSYKITNALTFVSGKNHICKSKNSKYKVCLIDYGAKANIIRELVKRDCDVYVFNSKVFASEILSINPDGIMLSNGPGDPSDNSFEINELKNLFSKKPIFGICLGHQLLALANGAKTSKMHFGHRGVNQPVKDVKDNKCYITSQNHGYQVDASSLKKGKVSFINANDNTVEGIDYPKDYAFTVQFHPEACSGPKDTNFLFDKFISLMEEFKNANR